MDTHISFGKIVASPTFSSWSQVYSAGTLFAVISLSKNKPSEEEQSSLSVTGKELLNTLEQEYFSLEEKNLEDIKQAVIKTKEKSPAEVEICLIVCAIVKDIAYIFLVGNGKILLKRQEKLGILLSSQETDEVVSASGKLEDNDLLILKTQSFAKLVSFSDLENAIDHNSPSEIAETLSPSIHQKEEGGAACLIIRYTPTQTPIEQESEEEIVQPPHLPPLSPLSPLLTMLKNRLKNLRSNTNLSKQLFLSLAGVIVLVLIISVFLTIKARQNAKQNQLFKEVVSSSSKKYDEGQNLLSLNKNLARDDFLQAQKLIEDNLSKFPKASSSEKQLQDLLNKYKDAVNSSLELAKIEPKEVSKDSSLLLSAFIDHNALFAQEDDEKVYFLDSSGISALQKKTKTTKQIIKNSEYKNPIGLGTFFSNIYLIDNGNLDKFVYLDSGYAKTNYFPKDTNPDLSKTVDIAVDGAVWVLRSDGTIQKFLKGNVESFSVNGLDKQFASPSRIFTTVDSNKLYILDNGNSRIVAIGKDGTYKLQYQSDLIKKSKAIAINEKSKKGYLLNDNKVFEFELK